MGASPVDFATAARMLGAEARRAGLRVPGFRSPPSVAGVDRSLRWRETGTAAVAVRLAGRPLRAVLADMVDGVLAANALSGEDADRWRAKLLAAVGSQVDGA